MENDDEPVANLIPGEYVLGRGPMLKCFDKRVSRKHAVLKVGDSSVTLTATHINPCFHRAGAGQTTIILPKDIPKQLETNDKFALLPDQFWYKIKIENIKDEDDDKSPQLTQNQMNVSEVTSRMYVSNETICVEDTNSREASKIETVSSDNVEGVVLRNGSDHDKDHNALEVDQTKEETVTKELVVAGNPIPSTSRETNTTDVPAALSKEPDITKDESQSLLGSNAPVNTVNKINSDPIEISSGEGKPSGKRNSVENECKSPKKRRKVSNGNSDESKTTDDGMPIDVSKEDEMKANIDEIEIVEEESQLNLFLMESSEDSKKDDMKVVQDQKIDDEEDEHKEIDTKCKDEPSQCAQKEESANNSNANSEASKDKEEEKTKPDQGSSNQIPNTSNDAGTSSRMRRDRCWYGTSCYRKQPSHKTEFSHPGDDDYASDPNDDRPACPYGAGCYRKNLLHRRQYKHPGPPARKPNDGGRRRRAATNGVNYNENDTPDDYDFSDPFIDDGSSDEYVESDYSDSETDTENTQSQGDEDLKRLLRDAKKFTGN